MVRLPRFDVSERRLSGVLRERQSVQRVWSAARSDVHFQLPRAGPALVHGVRHRLAGLHLHRHQYAAPRCLRVLFPARCAASHAPPRVCCSLSLSRSVSLAVTHSVGCGANPQPTECKSPDGNWDLSPLAGADLPGADSTYSYFLHPCGVANETVCAGTGGSFCQYTHSMPSTFMHTLARWDRTGYWTQCSAADCPYGGVQIWYQNGDRCGGSGPYRDVTFTFACPAPGQASSTAYTVVTSGCEYAVSMVNKVGCGNNSTRLLATAAAADAEAKADAAEAEANAKPADDESQPW